MKYLLLLLVPIICFISHSQQIGVNPNGELPNTSSALDVDYSNKGVLIPRVALTSTDDITTIPSPALSLLIYNTSTAGVAPNNVTPGYYYWDGVKWRSFLYSNSPTILSTTVLSGPTGEIRGNANCTTEAFESPYVTNSVNLLESGTYLFVVNNANNWSFHYPKTNASDVESNSMFCNIKSTTSTLGTIFIPTLVNQSIPNGQSCLITINTPSTVWAQFYPITTCGQAALNLGATHMEVTVFRLR